MNLVSLRTIDLIFNLAKEIQANLGLRLTWGLFRGCRFAVSQHLGGGRQLNVNEDTLHVHPLGWRGGSVVRLWGFGQLTGGTGPSTLYSTSAWGQQSRTALAVLEVVETSDVGGKSSPRRARVPQLACRTTEFCDPEFE